MSEPRDIEGMVDLASAFYGSAVLFAALELDIFTRIQNAPDGLDSLTLASEARLNPRGCRLLLDACVALGLLTCKDDTYQNTPAGRLTLVNGAPHDLTKAIRYNHDVYPAWGRLTELVRSGEPVEPPEAHLGADAERTRRFVLSMHGRAMGIGRAVVPLLPLQGCRRVLDLAGGPGTYAVLMAQAHDELHCVSVDLPAISAVAAELVREAGMEHRVDCVSGDYHVDEFGNEAFDVVTIFGALHQESPESILSILQRAWIALRPGGTIHILDMMTDRSRANPAFSALFAVNMALTTYNGWVFSDQELYTWLQQIGFNSMQTQPLPSPMPHWLVSARRPE